MYLRALGSLLTRRFSPRGIARARVQAQAESSSPSLLSRAALGASAAGSARALHTLRDLAIGGDGSYGIISVTAITGSVGIIYLLSKSTDDSADSLAAEKTGKEVAAAETGKEVASVETGKEVASVETGKEVASVETGKQGSAVVMGKEPPSAAAPVKRAAVVASRKEVSAVETGKEVSAVSGVIKDGDMDDTAERAMFMDKDGKMNWLGYIDYLRFGSDCEDKKTPEQEKVEELWKDADRVSEREDLIDEAAMKIRFQEWMEKFGKKYRSKEETAMRYKRFKKVAKFSDDYNAFKSSNVISPNYFADITEEEYKIMHPLPERDDQYWEEYVALLKSMLAQRNANSHGAVTGSHGHEAGGGRKSS